MSVFEAAVPAGQQKKPFDWGAIQGIFRSEKQTEWTIPEAFLCLITMAATCDGEMSPEEQDEILALARRSRSLKSLGSDQLRALTVTVAERINKRKDRALSEACSAIPGEMRLSIFTHVLDITLADGQLNSDESAFLNQTISHLSLDEAEVRKIAEVMTRKAEY